MKRLPVQGSMFFPVPKVFYTQSFLLGNILKSLETKYQDKNLQNVAATLA